MIISMVKTTYSRCHHLKYTICIEFLWNTSSILYKSIKIKYCYTLTHFTQFLQLHDFWCPQLFTDVDGKELVDTLPNARHPFNFTNSCGLRYEAEEVRQCIVAGRLQSASVSHVDSLLIARIQDQIRKQVGVVFAEDEQFAV